MRALLSNPKLFSEISVLSVRDNTPVSPQATRVKKLFLQTQLHSHFVPAACRSKADLSAGFSADLTGVPLTLAHGDINLTLTSPVF